ncbi:hypothetical protein JCM8547_002672 [Rhodosporidiobolus lusitaniae]
MFTFCIQKDIIRVEPRDFAKDPVDAIREEIHRRYANKVLPNVGLVISLLDILSTTEGAVMYGDGCYYYRTEFRLIIFRPYVGEAIVGKVKSQSPEGIVVTVGFFDDILIPPSLLPDYSTFDHDRRAFFWLPSSPDQLTRPTVKELLAAPADEKLYLARKDWVRVRVEEERWDDTSPTSGKAGEAGGAGGMGKVSEAMAAGVVPGGAGGVGEGQAGGVVEVSRTNGKAPYALICSMAEDGTGVLECVLHRNHFRKDWQSRVKTWFDQPGRKHSRRVARQAKAVKAGLRPTELLRPAVRAPTVRYNRKLRAGRGFTKQELSGAGIRAKEALSIGIPVDHRRRNKSEEGLKINVERLEQYKARLVVFPRKAGKVKKGDTEGADKSASRVTGSAQAAFPLPAVAAEEPREVTAEEKSFNAYAALRKARSDARLVGVRAERKRKAEEEAEAKKK